MSKADYIEKRIKALEKELELCKSSLVTAQGDEYFFCPHCTQRTKVSGTTIVREHFYISPHGCTGGDYWRFNHYLVVCEKCSAVNKVIADSDLYNFVDTRIRSFNSVLDWHPSSRDPYPVTVEWLRSNQSRAA